MATQHALYSRFGTQPIGSFGRHGPGRIDDITTDDFDVFLDEHDIRLVILIDRQIPLIAKPPLMPRLYGHTPPLLLKHDWTYDLEAVDAFNDFSKSGHWEKHFVPPFFNVYTRESSN